MGEWREVLLEELAASSKNALVGGPFGSDLVKRDYVPTGVAVIRGENLSNGRWVCGDFVRVSGAKAAKLASNSAREHDIIFTQRGANHYKQVAIVPEWGEETYIISQSQMKLTVNEKIADPLFVYYLFQDDRQRDYLRNNAISTGVPHTNLGILRSVPLRIPDIQVQRQIASVLSAVDDKIELNRRMNETLEAMARATFKDWFVHFGPTRAKAEGRAPYLAPDLWALFPDALDDEDKPVGWGVFTLADLAQHHRATVSPGAEPEQTFEHYSIPAYDAGNEPVFDLGGSIKSNKTVVPEGAVLLSKLNPEIERVWLSNPNGELPQVASTEFMAFTPLAAATRSVLFCMFKSEAFRAEMAAMVTGTSKSHQRVPPKALLTREVLTADPRFLAAFDKMVQPFLQRMLANRGEARTLAQTRDLLLPKLMSGEIRLAEAEKAVEAVA